MPGQGHPPAEHLADSWTRDRDRGPRVARLHPEGEQSRGTVQSHRDTRAKNRVCLESQTAVFKPENGKTVIKSGAELEGITTRFYTVPQKWL